MKIKQLLAGGLVLLSMSAGSCTPGGINPGTSINGFSFWINSSNSVVDLLKQRIVPKFKEKYGLGDDFEILLSPMGDYNGLYDALQKAIPANTVPTMAVCYPDHAATYVKSNSLVNIEDFLNDPELNFTEEEGGGPEDYVDAFWDEGKDISGVEGIYTVPLYKSTEVMYFNRNFFNEHDLEIPTTWDELIEVARQIQNIDSRFKTDPEYYPIVWDSDSNLFITHAYQNNIPYTDPSQTANPFVFNNQQNKDFVKELYNLHQEHLITTKGALSSYSSAYLTNEQCIIAIGSTGGSSYNITNNFQLGIAPEPYFNKDNISYIQQGPDVCFFRRSTDTQLQWAWKFYKFLTETETNFQICGSISYNPVRKSSYALDDYQAYISQYADIVDHPLDTNEDGSLKYTSAGNMGTLPMTAYVAKKIVDANQLFYSPAFPGSAEARGDASSGVGNIIAGTLTYTGNDVDGQIDTLFANAVKSAMLGYAGN